MLRSKEKYALLIMCCISRLEGEAPVRKGTIAGEVGISINYVEQILAFLRHARLVKGVRGVHGGYRLAKEESEITAFEILEAVDGDFAQIAGLKEGRSLSGELVVLPVWQGVADLFLDYFSGFTLDDLREGSFGCFHIEPNPKKKPVEHWEIGGGSGGNTCWDE